MWNEPDNTDDSSYGKTEPPNKFALVQATWQPTAGGYTTDRAGEVERLISIGATRYPWRYRPGANFVVLEDPDGNLFCVVQVAA